MKEYVLLPSYSWLDMEYCYQKALLDIVLLLFVTLLTMRTLECCVRETHELEQRAYGKVLPIASK
jgi:hypothetical protein